MTEMIDILDSQGTKTGATKPASEVHTDGDWHRTVHVWILNSKHQLLLQRRSPTKVNFPDMWDISAAGHVDAGESSIETAIRETKEEIGLDLAPQDLEFLFTQVQQFTQNNGTFVEHKFDDVYLVRRDVDIVGLVLQPEEVTEMRYIDVSEFEQWVREGRKDMVPNATEYPMLIERLKHE
jgi:isopentenyl-diphosphate delta-isomerase type 1